MHAVLHVASYVAILYVCTKNLEQQFFMNVPLTFNLFSLAIASYCKWNFYYIAIAISAWPSHLTSYLIGI